MERAVLVIVNDVVAFHAHVIQAESYFWASEADTYPSQWELKSLCCFRDAGGREGKTLNAFREKVLVRARAS